MYKFIKIIWKTWDKCCYWYNYKNLSYLHRLRFLKWIYLILQEITSYFILKTFKRLLASKYGNKRRLMAAILPILSQFCEQNALFNQMFSCEIFLSYKTLFGSKSSGIHQVCNRFFIVKSHTFEYLDSLFRIERI